MLSVPITQNSEINPDQHTEPRNETIPYAAQALGEFPASSAAKLNAAVDPTIVEDDDSEGEPVHPW